MADPITLGTTGLIGSIGGAILAIFGIKKQLSNEIKGCFKPELDKLDTRIKRLEGIDVMTNTMHEKICQNTHSLLESELRNIREKMESNQTLIIEKIDNISDKVSVLKERRADKKSE